MWGLAAELYMWWTFLGAGVYAYLRLTREPPEKETNCYLITMACGPAAWFWVLVQLHQKCLEDEIQGNRESNREA